MKHILGTILIVGLLSLGGCAHVLVRPQADQVKKVAIVSVYMNRKIYDVEAPKQGGGEGLGALVKAAASAAGTSVLEATLGDVAGYQPVVAYGLTTFGENLNVSGRWEVVPANEIVGHPSYKDFLAAGETGTMGDITKGLAKLGSAEFVGVDGMIVIPVGSMVEAGSTIHFGDETSTEKHRKMLGKLAQDLGVDGVAIVEVDAAYDRAVFNLPVGLKRATPTVSVAAVIVDQKGDIALKTSPVVRGEGDRYEGETVGMLRDEYVELREAEVQSAYNGAIEKAAIALRERIVDEFGK